MSTDEVSADFGFAYKRACFETFERKPAMYYLAFLICLPWGAEKSGGVVTLLISERDRIALPLSSWKWETLSANHKVPALTNSKTGLMKTSRNERMRNWKTSELIFGTHYWFIITGSEINPNSEITIKIFAVRPKDLTVICQLLDSS